MTTVDPLYTRAVEVLPGGNTRSTVFVAPHPPYAVRGSGAVVVDSTGHEVIDCNNNYTALIHGHAHPEILEAAATAASSGTAFGLPTHYEVDMAELLRHRTGVPQWRFCNSGTEAVMMLVRAARAHTGRDLIIRFSGSYHGTYDGVVSQGASGVPAAVADSFIVLPPNDVTAFETAMREHGDRVAAVLIDLMPNRAGLVPSTQEFVDTLRTLSTAHGALLAVDEIITFRLGFGGLHQRYGITPDLVSLGKIIGGGYPIGAIGGSPDVLSSFSPLANGTVAWGGTFSANPVTMAAGATALRLFDTERIEDLNSAGDQLRIELSAAGLTVNGSGSLLRLVVEDTTALWWELYRHGVLVGTNGLLSLSTAMNDEQIESIRHAVLRAHSALDTRV
ncbi:aminotransferase class III-fold pyridoxal phosphate-dependent enzyme [Rhodococcus sp. ABRD24]|uniref:aspartate aminotransferase family protein n=1 Tax=Rhodococcus sp. ABRD24 TaxID=2507582 RepID=UPI00103AA864|nr:aminotransferase class III-fold pyridoxal phosphate-dependent enzyme [Rhodococcus sp. ABRD24]QBJ96005.1 aminotransferase class III-fold pyridoxal phosphate-dependent enzyme [Rhodococcus sp. ABRD24]